MKINDLRLIEILNKCLSSTILEDVCTEPCKLEYIAFDMIGDKPYIKNTVIQSNNKSVKLCYSLDSDTLVIFFRYKKVNAERLAVLHIYLNEGNATFSIYNIKTMKVLKDFYNIKIGNLVKYICDLFDMRINVKGVGVVYPSPSISANKSYLLKMLLK